MSDDLEQQLAEANKTIEAITEEVRILANEATELEKQLAEARKSNLRQRVEDICYMEDIVPIHALDLRLGFGLMDKFKYIDNMTVDGIIDWLIDQGVEGK